MILSLFYILKIGKPSLTHKACAYARERSGEKNLPLPRAVRRRTDRRSRRSASGNFFHRYGAWKRWKDFLWAFGSLRGILFRCRNRRGYAFEALTVLIDFLHEKFMDWEFISFTDPKNVASMGLLTKLGYKDLGYIPSKESQAFGKWITPITEKEFEQARIL